jgi:formate dehydrogenase subunit gamma
MTFAAARFGGLRRPLQGAFTVSSSFKLAIVALLATFAFASGAVFAQTPGNPPPSPNPVDANPAQAQQQRQMTQPLNNRPVWSEVRSGAPGYTSIPGRETNVLIQPEGQTWRAARVPIVFWGGLLFALAIVGLAVTYMIVGTLGEDNPPGGRLIERFTPADRYAHWLVAITWVILAVTGLILSLGKSVLLPLIGYTLFSWLATLAKNLHNFVGPILIIGVPWLFVRFIRDNGVSREDARWFANIVDYFKEHEYPSGRFNAGEKVVFWLILTIASPVLIVTGLILVFPNFDQTRQTMQITNVLHMITAYLSIALACVHIYLGTIGLKGAYRAMRDGYVDESWAAHHHKYWYDDIVAGRSRQHFATAADLPRAQHVSTAPTRAAD